MHAIAAYTIECLPNLIENLSGYKQERASVAIVDTIKGSPPRMVSADQENDAPDLLVLSLTHLAD